MRMMDDWTEGSWVGPGRGTAEKDFAGGTVAMRWVESGRRTPHSAPVFHKKKLDFDTIIYFIVI